MFDKNIWIEEGRVSHSDMARKVVIVAIKASKEVSKTAMVWALTHVVQPGDYVKLLAISPLYPSSSWIESFTRLTNECAGNSKTFSETLSDQREDIAQACSQMMLQLHDHYDPNNINIRIKIVSEPTKGVVVAEAKRGQSNWVILDKHLKYERKCCMEELQCNVVVVERSRSKILRLNLVDSPKITRRDTWISSPESQATPKSLRSYFEQSSASRGPTESPMTATDVGTSSMSSSELGTSSLLSGINGVLHKDRRTTIEENCELKESKSDSDSERPSPSIKNSHFHRWIENISTVRSDISDDGTRKSVPFSRKVPLGPPPLCSICQHKAPVFGNPPRWFTFLELELATGGFSRANFLAEGGFGSVHRGVLQDGQVVAVKQYKLASSQGDREFCSEVEVLSCAQHRNVVLLIGFCVEAGRRLLVYEYICNGSLDSHLYGRNGDPLEWSARQKIAVGAARGLRYLHEECRVGCIVHRDLRPNNILLTHDFEPLVGDFGLARWQPNGDMGVETRILGTFGYLAPEYAQSGQITEKADVYSFGVVLLELIAGRKAIDLSRPRGQQSLTEWARALFKKDIVDELVDPRLRNCYRNEEVHQMMQCASLCIRHDPYSRPRMSQVLRMLEGDVFV